MGIFYSVLTCELGSFIECGVGTNHVYIRINLFRNMKVISKSGD